MNRNIQLIKELNQQGLTLPYSESLTAYHTPVTIYGKTITNRIGIQPLEGFDCALSGGPTDMVRRRYLRFVNGGAGLIWFESTAVSENGKSNPRQMFLSEDNVGEFRELLQLMDEAAREASREPALKVMQLTHSGRVSKDNNWNPIPLAARWNQEEEADPAGASTQLASDDQIRQMIRDHILAARLAAEAGFDVVDIKACHGYFLSELLSAYHRPGPYGGSFENRTRALFEIIDGINEMSGGKIPLAVRLNAFDRVPPPYGYAMTEADGRPEVDLTETIRIIRMLSERGVRLINISASSPALNLFGSDPNDARYKKYISSTNLLNAVKILKKNIPDILFMGSGLSAFGAAGAEIGAGGLENGWFDIAGFGRQALAYPNFANDILNENGLDPDKCCHACNNCFKLMNPGHTIVGCIVKDREIYWPLYRDRVLNNK